MTETQSRISLSKDSNNFSSQEFMFDHGQIGKLINSDKQQKKKTKRVKFIDSNIYWFYIACFYLYKLLVNYGNLNFEMNHILKFKFRDASCLLL